MLTDCGCSGTVVGWADNERGLVGLFGRKSLDGKRLKTEIGKCAKN